MISVPLIASIFGGLVEEFAQVAQIVDAAQPDRYVESYMVESWAEHLRQHERVTVADRELELAFPVWLGIAQYFISFRIGDALECR